MTISARTCKSIALVVEDDQDQRDLVTMLLEEVDLRVVSCGTAEAASAVMEHTGSDVVLVFADVQLPGVRTGLDFADEVARNWPETMVIVTSGAPLPSVLPPGTTYLPKPWRALDVLAHVA